MSWEDLMRLLAKALASPQEARTAVTDAQKFIDEVKDAWEDFKPESEVGGQLYTELTCRFMREFINRKENA